MTDDSVALGIGGETVPVRSHVCWYYSGEDQLRETLAFLRLGLASSTDFCVLFADEPRFEGLLGWLSEDLGRPAEGFIASGQLALIGGAPSIDLLTRSIGETLDRAVAAGYRVIRFLGFIAWGAPTWPDDSTLLEFEASVNEVVTAYPAVIVCTYGVPTLAGASLIYGGLQAHPQVVLDGDVVDNPFYLRPAEFIERRRRSA